MDRVEETYLQYQTMVNEGYKIHKLYDANMVICPHGLAWDQQTIDKRQEQPYHSSLVTEKNDAKAAQKADRFLKMYVLLQTEDKNRG